MVDSVHKVAGYVKGLELFEILVIIFIDYFQFRLLH